MRRTVVIVAGGKGLRMGTDIPKQFLPVGGMPVLMRTINAFHNFDADMDIILVLPSDQQGYWSELCREYSFCTPHRIADGGETRFHSVRNGLALAADEGLIAVHDGVRPFVTAEVIERCFAEAEQKKAVIPVIPVVDTVRQLVDGGSVTVSRDLYRLVQTPQTFDAALLKEAYRQPYTPHFTDDASVVEAFGHDVTLVEGCRENIKITTQFDLKVAEAILA